METDPTSRTHPYGDAAAAHEAPAESGGERLEPGMLVADRYRIGPLLGEGGMGAVYFAEHVRVGRAVAVKVLASHWSGVEQVARRFRDEARAASAAGHPNIIEVFDAGELPDGRPYLVMEHIEGRELYDVVRRAGRLDVVRACRILRDVALALQAAHAKGIIHRDLKAENVMLVERGGQEIVKVLDFGIAANAADLEGRATVPGQIMGTPIYMAPEQAEGAPVTPAFDVYALGVLLHEALTGRTPFGGQDGLGLLVLKSQEPAASIATVDRDLPEELVALVDACLAIDPRQRPGLGEVVQRLSRVLESHEGPQHATKVLPSPGVATRGRRHAIVPIVVVTLLSIGIGAWALQEEPGASGPARRERSASARLPAGVEVPGVEVPGVEPTAEVPPVVRPELPAVVPEPAPSSASSGGPELDERASTGAPAVVAEPEPATPLPSIEASAGVEPQADATLCWRTRRQAQQAREAHDWAGVLRHTRSTACWSEHRDDRRRLRAQAHMELAQWSACVETTRGMRDAHGRKWHQICLRRQEQG